MGNGSVLPGKPTVSKEREKREGGAVWRIVCFAEL
jgi:hypothetical protein